jgi:cytidylate kinase
MDLYRKYYGIEVGKYHISDVSIDKKQVTLTISDDDLIELRNKKIDELGI